MANETEFSVAKGAPNNLVLPVLPGTLIVLIWHVRLLRVLRRSQEQLLAGLISDVGLCHRDCEPARWLVQATFGRRNQRFPIGQKPKPVGWNGSIVLR